MVLVRRWNFVSCVAEGFPQAYSPDRVEQSGGLLLSEVWQHEALVVAREAVRLRR